MTDVTVEPVKSNKVAINRYPEEGRDVDLFEFLMEEEQGLRNVTDFLNLWARESEKIKEFHLIRYEDLIERPADTAHRLFSFLSVDTDPAAFYGSAVDWMVARGYMAGYRDDTFRGGRNMKRGDMIRALHRSRPFADVGPRSGYRTAVDWARWRGYVTGYRDHTYRPTLTVDRGTAIAIVWKSQGSPAPAAAAPYGDTAGRWYQAAAREY